MAKHWLVLLLHVDENNNLLFSLRYFLFAFSRGCTWLSHISSSILVILMSYFIFSSSWCTYISLILNQLRWSTGSGPSDLWWCYSSLVSQTCFLSSACGRKGTSITLPMSSGSQQRLLFQCMSFWLVGLCAKWSGAWWITCFHLFFLA